MDHRHLPAKRLLGALTEHAMADVPALVADAGRGAQFAFEEFFYGQIRNPYTRKAYLHAVRVFSAWCDERGLSWSASRRPMWAATWIRCRWRRRRASCTWRRCGDSLISWC